MSIAAADRSAGSLIAGDLLRDRLKLFLRLHLPEIGDREAEARELLRRLDERLLHLPERRDDVALEREADEFRGVVELLLSLDGDAGPRLHVR
jgi:hypothetical protein